MMNRNILCVVLAFGLANCASVLSGTTQELVVNTNPPGANCVLNRLGSSIGNVNPTPGGVTIQKTKEDITIICNLEGYQEASHFSNSGLFCVSLNFTLLIKRLMNYVVIKRLI